VEGGWPLAVERFLEGARGCCLEIRVAANLVAIEPRAHLLVLGQGGRRCLGLLHVGACRIVCRRPHCVLEVDVVKIERWREGEGARGRRETV